MSKSPSLRRIQADIRELSTDPSDRYHAEPLEDDMFEWHFTIRGAEGTEFEGGLYHGRILLPPEYPFKPPHIIFLTPSGRFEVNTKICLSFSAYHPELWQPAWGIRLILEALISFLPTPADGAIGALDWTKAERKRLAKKSVEFVCPKCGPINKLLPEVVTKCKSTDRNKSCKYEKEIEALHYYQQVNEGKKQSLIAKENNANDYSDAKEEKESTQETEVSVEAENNASSTTLDLSRTFETSVVTSTTTTESQSSWNSLSDPVIHGSIVTFAAIVYLLYRKVESLLVELENLED